VSTKLQSEKTVTLSPNILTLQIFAFCTAHCNTGCLKSHYLFWKIMRIKKNGSNVWKIYLFQSKSAHLRNLYGVSKVTIHFEKQWELRKTDLRYEKYTYFKENLHICVIYFSYLKPVFLNSHCFSKWIVTFETPYKLRKCANLLWNKYIFLILNPFFLVLITFKNR
jgi:hypothetical protein